MIQALQQLAQMLHGVADAAERISAAPQVSADITLQGPSDRAQAEAIRRGQRTEELKEIVKVVRAAIDKR